jgi:uncharacterized protein (DUF58 family)
MRFSYRLYRLFSSTQYWLLRRFTKAGLLALIGVFMTMGLAVDTEQSVAYSLLAILLCLLGVAMIWAPVFRGRFRIERHLPRFATAGQPLSYAVTLQNLTSKTQQGLALREDLEDTRPSFAEFRSARIASRPKSFQFVQPARPRRAAQLKETSLPSVPAKASVEAAAEITPLRRGSLRFEGVTVARPDPLGLFRGFVRVPAKQSVLVLPRRYSLSSVALPGVTKYQQGGVALAGCIGESEEFVSLREYRYGDPLRHIHWKSWAKVGEPIVKEFQDEFFVRHALILDTFAGPEKADAFEEAVSVAASFACTIQTQESLLDLMFVGPQAFCFTAGRGVAHAEQMLEILASVALCNSKPFRTLQNLVIEHTPALSGCICIFLDWDEPRQELVRDLRQIGLPELVLVLRAPDENTDLNPGPLADSPGCLHALTVGKIAEGLQKLAGRC